MKKLLSIFLSFSLMFSLITTNDNLSESNTAFATSNSKDITQKEGSKGLISLLKSIVVTPVASVWNVVQPLMSGLFWMTITGVGYVPTIVLNGVKLIWGLITHFFSVNVDLFTGYKNRMYADLSAKCKEGADTANSRFRQLEQNFKIFAEHWKDHIDEKASLQNMLKMIAATDDVEHYLADFAKGVQ